MSNFVKNNPANSSTYPSSNILDYPQIYCYNLWNSHNDFFGLNDVGIFDRADLNTEHLIRETKSYQHLSPWQMVEWKVYMPENINSNQTTCINAINNNSVNNFPIITNNTNFISNINEVCVNRPNSLENMMALDKMNNINVGLVKEIDQLYSQNSLDSHRMLILTTDNTNSSFWTKFNYNKVTNESKSGFEKKINSTNKSTPKSKRSFKLNANKESNKTRGTKRHLEVGSNGSHELKKLRADAPNDQTFESNPEEFAKISTYLWEFFESHQQMKEMYIRKMKLRDALYEIMKDVFPYCGLYVIGSSMNGFGHNNSDMDLCLMLSHTEIDQKKEATNILKVLYKTLSKCTFLQNIKLIQAKVPILKFSDKISCYDYSQVECDLNINNSVGIRNTHLLNAYSSMDWRVAPLVVFVKHWAKSKGINDASQGTLSSYSLVLMVIHYLQCGCNPPLLPSLQLKYPHKFNNTNDIRTLTLNERLAPYKSPNKQTLGELFVGFIDYFTNKFHFESDCISVRLGRVIMRQLDLQNKSYTNQSKHIYIEEPFNLSNTAYSVFDQTAFNNIVEVIANSHTFLNKSKDLQLLIEKK